MQKKVALSQIVDFLTELVDNRTSGTLFVHSESNRAITIALDEGKIHALYFGAKRGRKAIPLISSISGGSYRFEVSNLVDTYQDLPSTREILSLLRNPLIVHDAEPADFPTSALNSAATRNEKKEILCLKLKGLLTEHMGPIAEIVFEDAVDQVGDFCATPQLTHDLINKLSEEIDNSDEVELFRNKAYVTLNNILYS